MKSLISASALAAFPGEACGLVLEHERVVTCRNISEQPLTNFYIDPVEAHYWWQQGHVTGMWHSHPNDPAVPSQGDEALAVPGLDYLIYSVTDEDLITYRLDEHGRLQHVRTE